MSYSQKKCIWGIVMVRRNLSFTTLIVIFAVLSALASETIQAAGDYLRMREIKIVDEHGFGRPIEAASLLLPENWQAESSVRWTGDVGCPENAVHLALKAQSPDGRLGFEVFPNHVWKWADDPATLQAAQQAMAPFGIRGCDILPPYDAAGYLQNVFLPRWRPDSTLIDLGTVAELAQALQLEQRTLAMATGQPAWIETDFDVAVALVETPGAEGIDEEWLLVTVMRTTISPPAMGYGLPPLPRSYSMVALSPFAARAPKGELEKHDRLFEVIYRSFRSHPLWDAGVAQFHQNIAAIQRQGIADRSRIIAASGREIGAIIEQVYEARRASQDRSFERQIQALRGVESWIDPLTRSRVQLTSGYRGAWSNGLGDFILSENPDFKPEQVMPGRWTPLKPDKP